MFVIKKVSIIVPCYNEERGISMVIDSVPVKTLNAIGYESEIIVIDNNSTDSTAEIARSKGAKVVIEKKQGKGYAMIRGFREIDEKSDIVAMIDGDASYDLRELPRLLEPLENGFGEVIVGSRLHGRISQNSMTSLNRLGNWFFTFLSRVGYKTNVTDVCSGFIAWRKFVIDNIADQLTSDKFSIEMEMIAKLSRSGYTCYSVPISYYKRNGKSNLRPFRDGFAIIFSWARYLRWSPKFSKAPENILPDTNKQEVK